MDKTAIKNFAVSARQKLIKAVTQKAYDIGIMENEVFFVTEVQGGFIYNEQSYTKEEFSGRKKLIAQIMSRADSKGYAHGYEQVMEEAAYTWFNRFIALRFMEVNGYLPSNIRILSSATAGKIEPDVIREVESLAYVDLNIVGKFLNSEDTDKIGKLYKYILIAQCNELSKIMPKMFQNIADYTELLLPDKLYLGEGIIRDLVDGISEDDFKEQVEIIGWLYQYYISEKKDEVFAGLKKNVKITKENIPAATQLFTPDWIVKYMVENSLGRLVVEKLNLNPKELGWKYYLAEAEQTNDVINQLEIINANSKDFDIKNVKLIDPCMGSGHILVYAFDVFYQIYESLGYSTREIPGLILTHNIYGLDIDDRAGQLAYFALMMKARNKSRRFFRDGQMTQINTYSMIESDEISVAHLQAFANDDITYLHSIFADAKEYGSILKIERKIDYDALFAIVGAFQVDTYQISFVMQGFEDSRAVLLGIINIAKLLTQKYDVVVTNPPYMGGSGMGAKLSEYVKKNFANSKSDLFAVFIEKCGEMLKPNGLQAMITQHAFMFLSSYEKLRAKLMLKDIVNMAHLGARAFEEIGGEVVQTTSFVLRKSNVGNYKSTFVRLVDFKSQQAKEEAFLSGENRHVAQKENFAKIPGMPVAYWVSEKFVKNFDIGKSVSHISSFTGSQHKTADNEKFIKFFWEIPGNEIGESKKWCFYIKGGEFRRWYGNIELVIDWSDAAIEFYRCNKTSNLLSEDYRFKEGITYTSLTSAINGFRYLPPIAIFDIKGPSLIEVKELNYILGLFNTKVANLYFKTFNATITLQVKDVKAFPILLSEKSKQGIDNLVTQNITISRTDWDSFETSWDFVRHPLVHGVYKFSLENTLAEKYIESSHIEWKRFTENQFTQLKQNEEELNRIFIEIYGLQDELTPEVADKDVTIRKADLVRDVKSFISYAVGCMFGRYSLDMDGLAFAGGVFDKNKYKTYIPEDDNIIPITDNDYFDDDIVLRFVEFVRTVYGNETLDDNLDFIANALYPSANGTTLEKIRRYFLNDFYKDHVKIYQKRPIYWQFESPGKQGGFKALIYLHRYDKYTVARVRTDYLHPLQRKYEAAINSFETLSDMTDNASEKAGYKKQSIALQKKIDECRIYDQVIAHIAHQTIELDLDDGVKVNYAKFQGVEVPQGDGKTDTVMDLMTKI